MRHGLMVAAAAALAAWSAAGPAPARAGAVLDRVKARGSLICGAVTPPDDFNKEDAHAAMPAFNSDLCRGIAAAVLGSADKGQYAEFPSELTGFEALRAGKVDVLMGATPSTASGVAFGASFTHPVFFDADGVLVNKDAGIARFADLDKKLICYVASSPEGGVLDSEAARRHVAVRRFDFEERGEMLAAVAGQACDALFGPVSRLAAGRSSFHALTEDFVLLPDRLSVIPMAPAVAPGDPAWAEVVEAATTAPLLAESRGVTKATAATLSTTEDPVLRPLGGVLTGIDPSLVDRGWGARVVAAVGNYGEIYERDLGSASDFKLPRGLNALWTDGGLMVPPAIP